MNEIIVEQIDWDGKGNTRKFYFWKTYEETPAFLARIERAYHMPSTKVVVKEA